MTELQDTGSDSSFEGIFPLEIPSHATRFDAISFQYDIDPSQIELATWRDEDYGTVIALTYQTTLQGDAKWGTDLPHHQTTRGPHRKWLDRDYVGIHMMTEICDATGHEIPFPSIINSNNFRLNSVDEILVLKSDYTRPFSGTMGDLGVALDEEEPDRDAAEETWNTIKGHTYYLQELQLSGMSTANYTREDRQYPGTGMTRYSRLEPVQAIYILSSIDVLGDAGKGWSDT